MKLFPPSVAPSVALSDTNGLPIEIGNSGRYTLLTFFRDTNCPFCNVRVYELTQRHNELKAAGVDVVAFFVSSVEEVQEFIKSRPRPFRVAADPDGVAYEAYGIQRSFARKIYGVFKRIGMWTQGMRVLGFWGTLKGAGGLNTNNVLPADFLLDERGNILEAYYGADPGDHIPLARIHNHLSSTSGATAAS